MYELESTANIGAVSEPIGLEIVAFNGGSYTGAILFTGWMYIGGAVCLWLVRAWKIGEMEWEAAIAGKEEREIDPLADRPTAPEGMALENFQRSPFVKRMFMWQKV